MTEKSAVFAKKCPKNAKNSPKTVKNGQKR
jgi:hypothetical protein